ncbi:RecQ family ATP-dependent DNA helicase [Bacillus wiedmannii]|uniref:RecQ family ATP-dependent DNA helicase n=1 Tax=Bacillus wiedmannii TaxID=1890302 RepID=UPI00086405A0|nr:RecQ family ATP-dependent DNA helicase [Bacillus wiedmannii]SCN10333.1 ATP-dependent DNA helicase RecQ [Bacillus wiedmannii]
MRDFSQVLDKKLAEIFGKDATFHKGQKKAILSVLNQERTLVVQKTGWGKSLVYFLATKILREEGAGVTIIISPLLSLMRNQVESAQRFGLTATSIDSSLTKDEIIDVQQKLSKGNIDVLFISPERLGNKQFTTEIVPSIHNNIGMFVVDEAHCISDWGHDFRPDYRRISRFIQLLGSNVPVLATTATANNRVVEDIKTQLGLNLTIIRGSLTRKSLKLQNIILPTRAERLAWIAQHINKFPGSGIIYCSTVADCEQVAEWLQSQKISAVPYHGQLKKDERIIRENYLKTNQIKVLVANIALGMGFDKDDIGFVIHYQIPNSLITYYQQIGRAGRNIDTAYIVLLHGKEDLKIQEHFIKSSFPSPDHMEEVAHTIESSQDGMKKNEIYQQLNLSTKKIDQCLQLLIIDQIIYKDKSTYYRSTNPFNIQLGRINNVTAAKNTDLQTMKQYAHTKDCLMQFITAALDDPKSKTCGTCANCTKDFISKNVNSDIIQIAVDFLTNENITIKPRKQHILKGHQAELGLALCRYGHGTYGPLVKEGKYKHKHFSDDLVKASIPKIQKHIQPYLEDNKFIVTAIPSLRRPELVPDFAKRVAKELNLPYVDLLEKISNSPEQKQMQNKYLQQQNVRGSLHVLKKPSIPNLNVLLIDDMVDSRWTFAIAAELLKGAGFHQVIPFALAVTTGEE